MSKGYTVKLNRDNKASRPWRISFDGWQYRDSIPNMIKWCNDQFGIRNEQYNNPRWCTEGDWGVHAFRFKNEKDANWFLMKWS